MLSSLGPISLTISALILIWMFWQTLQDIRNRQQDAESLKGSINSQRERSRFTGIIIVLLLSAIGLVNVLVPTSSGEVIGLNMNILAILTASSWIILLILFIGARWWSLRQVGLIIFPLASMSFLLALIDMPVRLVLIEEVWPLEAHIWLSLVAYGFLTIAGVQAIFVIIKERSLKSRQTTGFVAGLPSLSGLEKTLFRLATLSYIWLTLALVTGFLFLENIWQQQIAHKVILSVLAWGLLSIFIIGHKTRGWRGKIAARWVVIAFVLVLIGFTGSQVVYDFVLSSPNSVSS